MTILYIAGPISGKVDMNRPAFDRAQHHLEERGYTVLNPFDVEDGGGSRPWDWYMKRTLAMMFEADAVAVLPDWKQSRGASLEVHVAEALHMPVHSLVWWMDHHS